MSVCYTDNVIVNAKSAMWAAKRAIRSIHGEATAPSRLTRFALRPPKTGIYTWDYFYHLGSNKFSLMKDYIRTLKRHGLSRDPRPK
ncbi:hypothetical protein AKJ16_DCAP02338 [Drosera capensis]